MTSNGAINPLQGAKAAVLTVSDTRTLASDQSGQVLEDWLVGQGVQVERRVVTDDQNLIKAALIELADRSDLVFTTGGTGFAQRDVTPEATAEVLEKRADSLCELMRLEGLKSTRFAHLSRGIAGMRGSCLIVNFPGSPQAVEEGLQAIGHLFAPILSLMNDGPALCHRNS